MNDTSPRIRQVLTVLTPLESAPPDARARLRARLAAPPAIAPSASRMPLRVIGFAAAVIAVYGAYHALTAHAPVVVPAITPVSAPAASAPESIPPITIALAPRTLAHRAPEVHVLAPQPVPVAAPQTALPEKEDPLSAELQLVQRAQFALRMGDLAAASAALATHADRFAHGELGEECEALTCDLLSKQQDPLRARTCARDFIATHSQSLAASRMRELMEETRPQAP